MTTSRVPSADAGQRRLGGSHERAVQADAMGQMSATGKPGSNTKCLASHQSTAKAVAASRAFRAIRPVDSAAVSSMILCSAVGRWLDASVIASEPSIREVRDVAPRTRVVAADENSAVAARSSTSLPVMPQSRGLEGALGGARRSDRALRPDCVVRGCTLAGATLGRRGRKCCVVVLRHDRQPAGSGATERVA